MPGTKSLTTTKTQGSGGQCTVSRNPCQSLIIEPLKKLLNKLFKSTKEGDKGVRIVFSYPWTFHGASRNLLGGKSCLLYCRKIKTLTTLISKTPKLTTRLSIRLCFSHGTCYLATQILGPNSTSLVRMVGLSSLHKYSTAQERQNFYSP